MESIRIVELNYRYILIEKYKVLGLSENELVVLLLVDNVSKESPTLITPEQLVLKMNLDEKEIDKILAGLHDKKFLSFETFNGIMITSLKPTQEKIIELIKNEWLVSHAENITEISEQDGKSVFELFEVKLNRSLTPLELDSIKEWLASGINKELIISALNEVSVKSKRITIRAVDKMILKMMQAQDIRKEGYSLVDEHHKKNIDETIQIASFDWVNKK